MRIGMILDNEFNGDIRVQNEVKVLSTEGHNVFVLCLNFGRYSNLENFEGATIVRIKTSKFAKDKVKFFSNSIFDLYSFWWKHHIRKFIKKYNLNVLHVHDLYMAGSVINLSEFSSLKTTLDLHENYPSAVISYSWANSFLGKIFVSKKRWLKREEKYLRLFNKIIVLSEEFKQTLLVRYTNLNKNKFIVYPNYPDIQKLMSYRIEENIIDKKNDFYIFYFGGIGKRRGIFTLLEAIKLVIEKKDNIKLLLIGPCDKADKNLFYSNINNLKIKKNIIYFKWKDISLLPSYLAISDVCLSPLVKNDQHESGVANKIFQYMLFGKPVIVSNCKPQQRIIEEEKCGLVFNSEDPNDLADKIEILYNNDHLRRKMGINGKRAVIEKYNLEKSSNNLITVYQENKNEAERKNYE